MACSDSTHLRPPAVGFIGNSESVGGTELHGYDTFGYVGGVTPGVMMAVPLRILLAEDSDDGVAIVLQALRRADTNRQQSE